MKRPEPERPEHREAARWLRRLAAETEPPRPLPTAGQLLWRAEVLRRLEAEEAAVERAARPLRWIQGSIAALLGVIFLGWLGGSLTPFHLVGASGEPASLLTLSALMVAAPLALAGVCAWWLLGTEP